MQLLKDFKVLKAVSKNPNLGQDQQIFAAYNINNIELALNSLNEKELRIINLRYFEGLTNITVSKKLKLTPEYLCSFTKDIIIKMNRSIAM